MSAPKQRQNPFPGMNPFLEREWWDVHVSLITGIRNALSAKLPEDLAVRAEENFRIVAGESSWSDSATGEARRADVLITERDQSWKDGLPPVWTPEGGEMDGVCHCRTGNWRTEMYLTRLSGG